MSHANQTGIDLSGPDWVVALAHAGAHFNADWLELVRAFSVTAPEWEERSVSDALKEALLARAPLNSPETAAEPPVKTLLARHAHPFPKDIQPKLPPGCPLAVCFPCQTPPLVRRLLPMLFSRQPLPWRGGRVKGDPIVGVEAPVALLLQAVGAGCCPLPTRAVLLTGGSLSGELTEVDAGFEAAPQGGQGQRTARHVLRVRVRACVSYSSSDRANIIEAWRSRLNADRAAWYLCASSERLADDAHALAEALGLPPSRLVLVDGPALALGAIRFAELLRKKPALVGAPDRLEVMSVAPHAVGIAGINAHGAWFWRRLIEAGTPLPALNLSIGAASAGPAERRYLSFLECGHPDFASRLWLHEDEWPRAELRWHDYALPAMATGRSPHLSRTDPSHAWSLQLQDRHWEAPWGVPRWDVRYHPPDDPHAGT